MAKHQGIHIAIEGMDGVGKSTVCKILSERTGFKNIDKPLRFLFNDEGDYAEYIRIRGKVNAHSERVFTSWFYGLSATYLYAEHENEDIITDRHLVSNFIWSGEPDSYRVFDILVEVLGCPDLTVILKASQDTILERLNRRDVCDSDIQKAAKTDYFYSKVDFFFQRYPMPHIEIVTDKLTPGQICDIILDKLVAEGIISG